MEEPGGGERGKGCGGLERCWLVVRERRGWRVQGTKNKAMKQTPPEVQSKALFVTDEIWVSH